MINEYFDGLDARVGMLFNVINHDGMARYQQVNCCKTKTLHQWCYWQALLPRSARALGCPQQLGAASYIGNKTQIQSFKSHNFPVTELRGIVAFLMHDGEQSESKHLILIKPLHYPMFNIWSQL